jgi:hypothetical protein
MSRGGISANTVSLVHQKPTGGRFGGGALGVDQTGALRIPVAGVNSGTVYLAFAFRVDQEVDNGGASTWFSIYNRSGLDQCVSVSSTPAHGFEVRDSDNSLVYTGGANQYQVDTWHYMEVKLVVSATVGALQIRIDGQEVVGTSEVPATQDFDLGASGGVPDFFWLTGIADSTLDTDYDDILIWDTAAEAGSSFIDQFNGDLRMYVDQPDADTASEAWTLSTGVDSYALLDDPLSSGDHNGDTDYIEIAINGATRVSFPALPADVGTIHAVGTMVEMKKTNAGPLRVDEVHTLVHAGVTSAEFPAASPGLVLQTDYTMVRHMEHRNPDDLSAWDKADADAVECGVNARDSV